MNTICEDKEIVVEIPQHHGGAIRDVLGVLAQNGLGVKNCLPCGNNERMLIFTEDPDKAAVTLESAGYRCRLEQVVVVAVDAEDRWAGMRIGQVLQAAGVLVLHSYIAPPLNGTAQVVLQTVDNRQAVQVLASKWLV